MPLDCLCKNKVKMVEREMLEMRMSFITVALLIQAN